MLVLLKNSNILKTAFEALLASGEKLKLLSKLYEVLVADNDGVARIRAQWERDLLVTCTEEEWRNLKIFNYSCSRNISTRENHCETLYRWDLTPNVMGNVGNLALPKGRSRLYLVAL